MRRIFHVVGRKEAEKLLAQQDGVVVVFRNEVNHSDLAICASGPPSCSAVTLSPVTLLIT